MPKGLQEITEVKTRIIIKIMPKHGCGRRMNSKINDISKWEKWSQHLNCYLRPAQKNMRPGFIKFLSEL